MKVTKLAPAVAARYPLVHMMISPGKPAMIAGRKIIGNYSCRLIKSDGLHALICDSVTHTVHLVPLRSVLKFSPRNDDTHVCRIDNATRSIAVLDTKTREVFNTGPIRGPRDPSVDLREVADELGLDFGALAATLTLPETTQPTCTLVSSAELNKANTVHSLEELWSDAKGVNSSLPSLDELTVADADFSDVTSFLNGFKKDVKE